MKKPAKLVVDANPILSARLGGTSRRVFYEGGIQEFAVPGRVLKEVTSYLPVLARKAGQDVAFLTYAVDLLPLTLYAAGSYRKFLAETHARIGGRDPNEVDVLAPTLSMGYPLWSNDRDFEGTGVQRYMTAQLLKVLFEQGNKA